MEDNKQILDDSLAEEIFGGDITIGGLQYVVKQKGWGQIYASGLITLQSGVVGSVGLHVSCSAADYLSDFHIRDVSLFHCCSFNHWKSERGRQPTKNNTPWSTRKISRDKVSVSSKYYFRF